VSSTICDPVDKEVSYRKRYYRDLDRLDTSRAVRISPEKAGDEAGIQSQEKVVPDSRVRESCCYENCGAIERRGRNCMEDLSNFTIWGAVGIHVLWEAAVFSPPEMAQGEALQSKCKGDR
jgi:hypothetical protein